MRGAAGAHLSAPGAHQPWGRRSAPAQLHTAPRRGIELSSSGHEPISRSPWGIMSRSAKPVKGKPSDPLKSGRMQGRGKAGRGIPPRIPARRIIHMWILAI